MGRQTGLSRIPGNTFEVLMFDSCQNTPNNAVMSQWPITDDYMNPWGFPNSLIANSVLILVSSTTDDLYLQLTVTCGC